MAIRRRTTLPVAAIMSSALIVAACGSSSNPVAGPTSTGSASAGGSPSCQNIPCAGEINGAKFLIELPNQWNGTLLVWNHGLRLDPPPPVPDAKPADTYAPDGPSKDPNDRSVVGPLLDQGYALAGSAYSQQNWAVPVAVPEANDLYNYFVEHVGLPKRTYVWGESLGGLITELEAEQYPWVTAAAPQCGVLAGTNMTMDLALDGAFGVQQLLLPNLQINGYADSQQAAAAFTQVYNLVTQSAKTLNKENLGKLLTVASIVDATTKTTTADGANTASKLQAQAEALLTGLGFGTLGRANIESQVGGNFSTNEQATYANRVTAAEKQQIDAFGGPGSANEWLSQLDQAKRVQFEQAPRVTANTKMGNPTGVLKVPTITLHTEYDPAVPVYEESVFKQRVSDNGKTNSLVQLYTKPPASYQTAPYGAGHCNFTATERLALIQLLDGWVSSGNKPTNEQIQTAFKKPTGLDLTYTPPPWPALPPEPISQPGQT